MGLLFGMRFDFRNRTFAGTTPADRYAAALEMAVWGERLGCLSVSVAEHHTSPDGYIPKPARDAGGAGGSHSTVHLTVAALVAPFYDPLRLADDLIVLDHLSRGRISVVVGGGYVPEEFATYGVPSATSTSSGRPATTPSSPPTSTRGCRWPGSRPPGLVRTGAPLRHRARRKTSGERHCHRTATGVAEGATQVASTDQRGGWA